MQYARNFCKFEKVYGKSDEENFYNITGYKVKYDRKKKGYCITGDSVTIKS